MTGKAKKAAYDRRYRKKNLARKKAQAAAYFQRTYDPVKAAMERKKKRPQHVEYCRQPKYRAYKRRYDKQRRASVYGAFADAYEMLKELQKEIRIQMPDRFERYAQSRRHQWNPINQIIRRERRNGRDTVISS